MEKLLYIEDVAERLNRSVHALRWMIQQGTAPKHAKIAGRICFRESDVESFISDAFAESEAAS